MAGIIIYESAFHHYDSLIFNDHSMYRAAKTDIRKNGDKILWKKGNISLEQIENSRETRDNLMAKLKEGIKVDLKEELDGFFR